MWWDKHIPNAPPKPERKPIPFMKMRYVGFAVTILVLVATTVSLATRGLNMGLDFAGGVLVEATRAEPFDAAQVRQQIEAAEFGESSINLAENDTIAMIRLPAPGDGENLETVTRRVTAALGEGVEIRGSTSVSGKVSDELLNQGVLASVLAVLAIGAYIWFRFESKFGWGALITTFHDVYAVIGLFSILQLTFDLTIVAGVLTVAGYSINDTVVVYDRIREMLKKYKKIPLPDVIDISITATLPRTLTTSVATLLASVSMMIFGGPVLFGFAVAITFGILIGTLSSIFVAAPLLLNLPGRIPGAKYTGAGETATAA